ncbi:MAG: hypothetical protein KJ015_39630 [Myxococcales bacterium]|nr:hypothetical protein [Myxococcales bacterium]MCL4756328.1 hypothetical protein [Myxococcales bacterium]
MAIASGERAVRQRVGAEYRRRRPELGELYRVVADNFRTLEAAADQNVIAPLPSFVRDEFLGYLDCGVLGRAVAWDYQCSPADAGDASQD